jgi:glycosyltransferase 2 family protein
MTAAPETHAVAAPATGPTPRFTPGPGPRLLVRSPLHVVTLVAGTLTAIAGWVLATDFRGTITALTVDLDRLLDSLPFWTEAVPGTVVTLGGTAAVLALHVWTLQGRRLRILTTVYSAAALAGVVSVLVGAVVDPAVVDLAARARDIAHGLSEATTRPAVAAAVATVVVIRRALPVRVRRVIYLVAPLWVVAHLVVEGSPPYIGVVLDIGLGMTAGSVAALVLRTPSLGARREDVVRGLARSGIEVRTIEPASVDARGSVPWIATTPGGDLLFVKALSTEQRAADLLFRTARWVRLRRTGDGPPETSLRRSAEHEAFVAHHVRLLGVPTPTPLAVADLGNDGVALVYEGLEGRSLDDVAPEAVDDRVLREVWANVEVLRRNGVAHRDLRLANIFLRVDGSVVLIDFGFGELAASRQLLDTDVAELLASTACLVGVERAVASAAAVLGPDALAGAREWLHPLALSTATRRSIAEQSLFEPLREEMRQELGAPHTEREPLGRLSAQRLVGIALAAVGLYSLLAFVVHDELAGWTGDVRWDLGIGSFLVSVLVYPLAGMGFRAATAGRTSVRQGARTALLSRLPDTAPTPWSSTARAFAQLCGRSGLTPATTSRVTASWIATGMAVESVLVAGFAIASMRVAHGYALAAVVGLFAGASLAAVQVLLVVATPWGRELRRVWLSRAFESAPERSTLTGTVGWWSAVSVLQAAAFALAARSVGASTSVEALMAVAVAAYAIGALMPSPSGIGAVEIVLYAGLRLSLPGDEAVLALLVGRLATFWAHLPVAVLLHRRRPAEELR